MGFTENTKVKPIVIQAIAQSKSPEAKRSLAWMEIDLLNKRLVQLDSDIKFAQTSRDRVIKIRKELLDNFPEGDES